MFSSSILEFAIRIDTEARMLDNRFLKGNAVKIRRRQFLRLAAGAAALLTLSPIARAETYPSRPITIIVPFAVGGPTSLVARIMAERMKMSLGQSIIIENVSGADGSIGVGRAARAAPDGYTISLGTWATHVLNGAIYTLRYDPAGDFEPIAPIVTVPPGLYAKKAMPANNFRELIAWLKANPDNASLGTPTSGMRALGALFQKETGTRFQFVPYRGEASAVQDLLTGQIDLLFGTPSVLEHVRAGNIKAYVAGAKTRLKIAPDIPTAEEVGSPALDFSPWWALFAPKGSPKKVTDMLNAAAVDALTDPMVRQRLTDVGLELFPRDQQTPEALGALVKADIEKWWPIIKESGIKAE
jgi:tripartite-type tricarboxylate transporter receptor subunit TctC